MKANRMSAFLAGSVSPFLRERGFRRHGQRYVRQIEANELFVRFQRLGDAFTCDVGVSNALVAATASDPEPPEHWAVRLGPIVAGYDRWWSLDEGEVELRRDFLPALEKGIEHVEPMRTDEGLRDALLRSAVIERQGLIPIHARWLRVLVRAAGVSDWADEVPVPLRGGGVLRLEASEPAAE